MHKLVVVSGILVSVFVAACKAPSVESPVVVQCSALDVKRVHPPGMALVGGKYGAMENTPIPLDAVQFTDTWLAKNVAVQGLYAEETGTKTVQVSARLVNCSDKTISISTRVSFLKASQAPAEPSTAWRSQVISPKATAVYQENSVSTGVAHYLIEVRPNAQGTSPATEQSKSPGPL